MSSPDVFIDRFIRKIFSTVATKEPFNYSQIGEAEEGSKAQFQHQSTMEEVPAMIGAMITKIAPKKKSGKYKLKIKSKNMLRMYINKLQNFKK